MMMEVLKSRIVKWGAISIILIMMLIKVSIVSAQQIKIDSNYVKEEYRESVWQPSPKSEEYQFKAPDTTEKVLHLTFEQYFDDSVQIYLNGIQLFSSKMKTNRMLSMVQIENDIKIEYEKVPNPIIEIRLIEKLRKIIFKPFAGYVYCFVNRFSPFWNLEYSNYCRIYY